MSVFIFWSQLGCKDKTDKQLLGRSVTLCSEMMKTKESERNGEENCRPNTRDASTVGMVTVRWVEVEFHPGASLGGSSRREVDFREVAYKWLLSSLVCIKVLRNWASSKGQVSPVALLGWDSHCAFLCHGQSSQILRFHPQGHRSVLPWLMGSLRLVPVQRSLYWMCHYYD